MGSDVCRITGNTEVSTRAEVIFRVADDLEGVVSAAVVEAAGIVES